MWSGTSTTDAPLRVAVIVGSTREGRAGGGIGEWFAGLAEQRDDLKVDLLDLATFDFPARYRAHAGPEVRAFTSRIGLAEAFVVVTPEYNRSFPAPLKEAIDYAYDEWHAKPVGFVSYGCHCEGLHAVEQLRSIFTELHTVTVRDSVGLDLLTTSAGDDGDRFGRLGGADRLGAPLDTPERSRSAAALLDQLTWWGLALRVARTTRPYVS